VIVSVVKEKFVGEVKDDNCATAVHKTGEYDGPQLKQDCDSEQNECATKTSSTSAGRTVIICRVCQGIGHKSFVCPSRDSRPVKKHRPRIFVNSTKQYPAAAVSNVNYYKQSSSRGSLIVRPGAAAYSDVVNGIGVSQNESRVDYDRQSAASNAEVSGRKGTARVQVKMKSSR
jgi:hypothetical protein